MQRIKARNSGLFVLILSFLAIASGEAQVQTPSAPTAPTPVVATPINLDGVSFASKPGLLYVSIKELASTLGEAISTDTETGNLTIKGYAVKGMRHLFDGTGIMPIGEAKGFGAVVSWDDSARVATLTFNSKTVTVKDSDKTVVVDKSQQALMAYQGSHLVLRTHVSTGREGHGTPNGSFTAGPAKERMHLSRLYNFAPMPYSVQVAGNVFIHGFTSVPDRPASHGCIRVPLTGGNPARYFYNWVNIGTPVTIKGVWSYRWAASHWGHHHHGHRFRYALGHHHRFHGFGYRSAARLRGSAGLHSASAPHPFSPPVSVQPHTMNR